MNEGGISNTVKIVLMLGIYLGMLLLLVVAAAVVGV